MVPAAITVLMVDSASLGTLTSGDRCRYLGLAKFLSLFSDIVRTQRSLASTILLLHRVFAVEAWIEPQEGIYR